MKKLTLIIISMCCSFSILFCQTQAEIEGGLKIGDTDFKKAGTMRWTGDDLEVNDEGFWISLASTSSLWGPETSYQANEDHKINSSDREELDEFGISVAISGETAVIGSWGDDHDHHQNHGSAYIFEKPVGGWINMNQTVKLTAFDAAEGDHFGISVDISGKIVVVGAWWDDLVGGDEGSAYIFVK